jgi:peptidoglycan/LPS O-acetylase OafA/YrhL
MRDHFHNLQALRGVACLMVVLGHLQHCEKMFGVQTPIFREVQWFGFAGVDLFFVLSGFLITSMNRKHLGRPAAVPGFLFRRFWRIYPMYWVTTAIAVAVLLGLFGVNTIPVDSRPNWTPWLFLVPTTTPNFVIAQAWTLVFEVMFYVAFAVAMVLPGRLAAVALGGWFVALVLVLLGPEPQGVLMSHVLSPFVFEFLGGCGIASLAARGECRWGATAVALGLVYAIAGMVTTHALASSSWDVVLFSSRTRVLIYGPPAVLLVYGFVALEGRWPRSVPCWLLAVGDASYSLYLLHPTVLAVGMYVGYKVPHSRLPHTLWLLGMLAACLAVGLLAYRFIEKPLLNLAKRKKAKPVPNGIPFEPPAKLAA